MALIRASSKPTARSVAARWACSAAESGPEAAGSATPFDIGVAASNCGGAAALAPITFGSGYARGEPGATLSSDALGALAEGGDTGAAVGPALGGAVGGATG